MKKKLTVVLTLALMFLNGLPAESYAGIRRCRPRRCVPVCQPTATSCAPAGSCYSGTDCTCALYSVAWMMGPDSWFAEQCASGSEGMLIANLSSTNSCTSPGSGVYDCPTDACVNIIQMRTGSAAASDFEPGHWYYKGALGLRMRKLLDANDPLPAGQTPSNTYSGQDDTHGCNHQHPGKDIAVQFTDAGVQRYVRLFVVKIGKKSGGGAVVYKHYFTGMECTKPSMGTPDQVTVSFKDDCVVSIPYEVTANGQKKTYKFMVLLTRPAA